MAEDKPRLIEHAFPLEQASLDSVHEKNVRHGHISTLHIWPARRPLAACRAALIATLLPDPGTPEKRKDLCEKIGGVVREKVEKKKMPNGRVVERIKRYTEGGILHWGRETENKETLQWFRNEIRKAYGGRTPKVLDPFAGGGAIPLEAMRLGCETTAIDINPVAWFILKCTLEYPQKLAGQTKPLPDFVRKDPEFMEAFLKSKGYKGATLKKLLHKLGLREEDDRDPHLKGMEPEEVEIDMEADLAWHIRAWGKWVLDRARKDLAEYYPTYADFESLKPGSKKYKPRERHLVPLTREGFPDIDALNAEFNKEYLDDPKNLRWVAKPTVAYLWARTVVCKNCRAIIPLLKTRWLCKRNKKRVLLTMESNEDKSGVVFTVQTDVPVKGGNAAQRREYDKRIGEGTMSRSGATCLCCGTIMTMEDIRVESIARRSGYELTAVITEGLKSKEYRVPTAHELTIPEDAKSHVQEALDGLPNLSVSDPFAPASTRSISAQLYGVRKWIDLYTPRQAVALAYLGRAIHKASARMRHSGHAREWATAISHYLCLGLDRLLTFLCVNAIWKTDADSLTWAFGRLSISLLWDFAEAQPLGTSAGSFIRCNNRIATALDVLIRNEGLPAPGIANGSASEISTSDKFDAIVTDPPYYQAVSYADLSDFSYTWLRGFMPELPVEFYERQSNKSKETVQHIRKDKDRESERRKYEHQMADAFVRAKNNLISNGRFVCVFAHKDPDAWETLVSAIIRAGFVVTASWPIQDNLPTRQRAASSAALASSVWLISKKRQESARPGWDNKVLEEMKQNISVQLREFWDAGIRGPDFVWAATGPALTAYSKYPAVKKANEPGKLMEVSEFLRHVRRIVVDFVVGRVLSPGTESTEASGLDDVTTYYLLHRHDFGMEDAPAGPCILYAVSCGLSDSALADQFDILARTGGTVTTELDEDEDGGNDDSPSESIEGTGSMLRLKHWHQRKNANMGYDPSVDSPRARADAAQLEMFEPEQKEPARRRMIPLIDQAHRLMHLWKAGDMVKVDDYLEIRALARRGTFLKLLQALIELSPQASDERSLLEKISNHIAARGGTDQMVFETGTEYESK